MFRLSWDFNMKKRNDVMPMPEKIRTPREELEMMVAFSDTPHFVILKRMARRYIEELKNRSYTLREEDPHFAINHTRYAEQGVGMGLLIKFVEGARKELEKMGDE